MAQNYIQDGCRLKWTNSTGADLASGAPITIGDMVGVTSGAIKNGETGIVLFEGVFTLPKKTTSGNAFATLGAKCYLEASSGMIVPTDNSGANKLAGYVWKTAVQADTTVQVRLWDC